MTSTTYRALDLLTKGGYEPKVSSRGPFWRPPVPKPSRYVHLPAWDWESEGVAGPGDEMADADVSGAFVAALTSGTYAHGALTRTGPFHGLKPAPGYYQILTPVWQLPSIVSPLGSAELPDAVWIKHPTLDLLQQLATAGKLPDIEVKDSYTAKVSCRLRTWGEKLRDDRAALLATRNATAPGTVARAAADKAYADFKDSYSIAIQMMAGKTDDATGDLKTNKSEVLRPDWYHTIHAQHAATMWRKVFSAHEAGIFPYAMGSLDEVTYRQEDWDRIPTLPKPPFRIDETGVTLGSFKVKNQWVMA
ncbi:hypothetical protein JGS39_24055 [Streptomyces sp. P01-B04]|uniref:hypothetical protein n=1 Tax=Streptomyces poriferorum TaxID=2798799 RepID=UPI001C5EC09B|nr:hypothetical protein [Streptomyces poriferorum]MBW5252036.1 hypothetical protein [Streptomyces poriferorum]MBW5260206.1 hypothetical protein [Streptomyces poriferorum]